MKGLVYHGPGQRSWDEVPDPTIEVPTDVVVRIDSSTICGTDLHILKGDVPAVQPGTHPRARGRRHDRRKGLGRHDARARRPRARVVHHLVRPLPVLQGAPLRPLHRRRRLDLRPPDRRAAGRVRARAVRRHVGLQDPGELDDEEVLFLADILPTAYEVGVLNGRVEPGDTVAIVGAGPIGLAAVLTARLFTPAHIVAIDLDDGRLERARELGADVTINNGSDDALAVVHEADRRSRRGRRHRSGRRAGDLRALHRARPARRQGRERRRARTFGDAPPRDPVDPRPDDHHRARRHVHARRDCST